jgi:hypothetical protein
LGIQKGIDFWCEKETNTMLRPCGILHRILILGFPKRNATIVSGVEEEKTHQATASAAIVSRVEEEGSRQGTTPEDLIASHISGAEEAAPEVPVYSVEQADGDGPTSDEGNEISFSGAEEIHRCLFSVRQRTSSDVGEHAVLPESPISGVEGAAGESDASMQYSSGDDEVARIGGKCLRSYVKVNVRRCTFQCVEIQENGSRTPLDYESPVRSLKELEEVLEECNSIDLILEEWNPIFGDFDFSRRFHSDVPELEVNEELIKLVMKINKDRVGFLWRDGSQFLRVAFDSAWYQIGGGDGEVIGGVSDVTIRGQGCNGFCIHELPYHATASQTALGI